MAYPIEAYMAHLRRNLSETRLGHSLNVSESAAELARRYGAEEGAARAAGLVHDIMKETPQDTQLQMIAKADIMLTDLERRSPPLLHAISGCVYCMEVLGITDADILMAVRYHTTGRAGMGLLEKIVFLADLISADRNYPDVERMRELAFASLDGAIRYAAGFLIQDLIKKGRLIHPDTVGAYNDTFPTEFEQKELLDGTT